MKTLLAFLIITLGMPIIASSQNTMNDQQYKNISTDLCNCVNKSMANISQELIDILSLGITDDKAAEAAIAKYMEKDPEKAMNEIMALDSLGKSMPTCIENLEKKYESLYSSESEDEIQVKLLEAMEKNTDCKLTYTLIKIGMKSGEE